MKLRVWHVALPVFLLCLACWWALIEGLLWLAGAVTGGTP